jgi:hypothetical protein
VHGDDELGLNQGAPLLGVGELPDAAQSLVWQTRPLEYLPRLLSSQQIARLQLLALEEAGILGDLVGRQGRDSNGGVPGALS